MERVGSMAQIDNRYAQAGVGARSDVAVDEGLRAYMLRVYNYMTAGVFLTGVVAYLTFSAAVVERVGPDVAASQSSARSCTPRLCAGS